jgi:hypothetical protein
MPTLTRRRSNDHHDCWHVYFGDVRVGTIAQRIGIPRDQHLWGWTCGFYPGSHPGPISSRAPFRVCRLRFSRRG